MCHASVGTSQESLKPLVSLIVAQPDTDGIEAVYHRLSPHAYAANQAGRVFYNLGFDQTLHSCPVREGECSWAVVSNRNIDHDGNDDRPGASEESNMLSLGLQRAVGEDWFAGVAIEYESTDLSVPGYADRDGYQVQLGGIAKGRKSPHDYTFSASDGRGSFDTTRYVGVPVEDVVATGERDYDLFSAHTRYAYNLTRASWYLRPSVDLGYTLVDADSFEETGASAVNLFVHGDDHDYVTARVDLQIGMECLTQKRTAIRPYARAGWTTFLSGTDPKITASLVDAPMGVDPFTTSTEIDDDFFNGAVGVDLLWANDVVLRLGYEGYYASSGDSDAFWLKVLRVQ